MPQFSLTSRPSQEHPSEASSLSLCSISRKSLKCFKEYICTDEKRNSPPCRILRPKIYWKTGSCLPTPTPVLYTHWCPLSSACHQWTPLHPSPLGKSTSLGARTPNTPIKHLRNYSFCIDDHIVAPHRAHYVCNTLT